MCIRDSSEVGAIVVLLVLALVAALCACQITFADIIDFFREKKDSRVEYDPEAVSYTHLDVYKRQVLGHENVVLKGR